MFKKIKVVLSLLLLFSLICNTTAVSLAADLTDSSEDGGIIYKGIEIYEEPDQGVMPIYVSFLVASITVGKCDQGMEVVITTSLSDAELSGELHKLGVKDIEVKRKVLLGWKHEISAKDAEITEATGFSYTFVYTGAVQGETYKVICTHYGEDDDGYREKYHDSGEFTYNFP